MLAYILCLFQMSSPPVPGHVFFELKAVLKELLEWLNDEALRNQKKCVKMLRIAHVSEYTQVNVYVHNYYKVTFNFRYY